MRNGGTKTLKLYAAITANIVIVGLENDRIKMFCECPFFFRVVYQQSLEKFTITSLFLEHKNHPISSEDIKTYRKAK
jgi:hypothetical protein